MDKLKVKITCSEPFWWYINDEDVAVTEIETEMSLKELFDEIAEECYRAEETNNEPRIYDITFPNGENIVWRY